MKIINKILIGLSILAGLIIIVNVYLHFKYPLTIKYTIIPATKIICSNCLG